MRAALNTRCVWITAACITAVLIGCGKKEEAPPQTYVLPELNDANCKFEAISAMDVPLETKQQFGSLCARRSKPVHSEPKSYTF